MASQNTVVLGTNIWQENERKVQEIQLGPRSLREKGNGSHRRCKVDEREGGSRGGSIPKKSLSQVMLHLVWFIGDIVKKPLQCSLNPYKGVLLKLYSM